MRSWARHLALWWHGRGCPRCLDSGEVWTGTRHIPRRVRHLDLFETLISAK